jgi:hypothetical protein
MALHSGLASAPHAATRLLRRLGIVGGAVFALVASSTAAGAAPRLDGGTGVRVVGSASGVADYGGTVSSGPLTVPGHDLLVIVVPLANVDRGLQGSGDPSLDGAPDTTVSGGGLDWHEVVSATNAVGVTEIWYAVSAGPLADLTVTAEHDGAAGGVTMRYLSVTALAGADTTAPIEASGGRTGVSGAAAVALDNATTGSLLLAAGQTYYAAEAPVPLPDQRLTASFVDEAREYTYWAVATDATGGSQSIGIAEPDYGPWTAAAIAVRPRLCPAGSAA